MPAETKRDEHLRLQARTGELRQEHSALRLDHVPFSKRDHDRHAAHLARHKKDLEAHRMRLDDEQG